MPSKTPRQQVGAYHACVPVSVPIYATFHLKADVFSVQSLTIVHLLRESTTAHEIDGEPWAAEMRAILYDGRDLAEAARSVGQDAVDPVAIVEIVRRYEACWGEAIKYHEGLPPLPRLSESNKGPKKRRKAHNLALRFQNYKDMVLLFLHDLSAPFTNNEAEQGLRMPNVREKVSRCFRTKKGMENSGPSHLKFDI